MKKTASKKAQGEDKAGPQVAKKPAGHRVEEECEAGPEVGKKLACKKAQQESRAEEKEGPTGLRNTYTQLGQGAGLTCPTRAPQP